MSEHLIYVPTNRPCAPVIELLAEEAAVVRDATGGCAVAVIEHSAQPWTEAHREALRDACDRAGVDALHMDFDGTSDFLRRVVDGVEVPEAVRARLFGLLQPTGVSYGAGPNKAALLACATGARVLHRRDSDVGVAEREGTGKLYPAALEVQAIDRRFGDLELEVKSGRLDDDAVVAFVGTGAFGSAVHDRRDLLAVDVRHIVEIELLATPEASREALMQETEQYMMSGPGIQHERDFFEEDIHARTCMGACTMADIFFELPEMPIEGTLGSDYLRRNALRYLGRPIVYHSRKIPHYYEPHREEQRDLEAVVDYARRDLRHMIIWPVLIGHHRAIAANPEAFVRPGGALDTAAYSANLLAALDTHTERMRSMPAAFARIYGEAAAEATDPARAERLRAISTAVEHGPDFAQEVIDGIADYVFLIEHWPALVASARRTSADTFRAA